MSILVDGGEGAAHGVDVAFLGELFHEVTGEEVLVVDADDLGVDFKHCFVVGWLLVGEILLTEFLRFLDDGFPFLERAGNGFEGV